MNQVNRIGVYASLATLVMTLVTFAVAILTPPLSGPLCNAASCYAYPYLDVAARFPRDYLWMYLAMLQLVAFVILMVTLHRSAPQEKRPWSQSGLVFACMSAAILLVDYFVQVTVVQPSLLKGEFEGIALISQYNPHGIFIALEELGYLLMSLSLALMAPVVGAYWRGSFIKWWFACCFVLNVLSLIFFSASYGMEREYIFEVASITINWIGLAIGAGLLFVHFRKEIRHASI